MMSIPSAPVIFNLSGKRVWVTGARGLVGSAMVRRLERRGDVEILTAGRETVDLTRQAEVEDWMEANRPDAVVVAAARVGGIKANNEFPADFIGENLSIALNLVHSAHRVGTAKLLYLGSSCIYPREASQPMREDSLLTGPLEPTNQWYAIAKIAGMKLCRAYRRQHGRDFISAMPTNLYGPGDNYDLDAGHVLPALLRKIHEAKVADRPQVEVWGSGRPLREFMHVDDLADALLFLLERYSDEEHVNVGSGEEISIADLVRLIAEAVDWRGDLVFNTSMPDGAPRKLMDGKRLASMGWRSTIPLAVGVRDAYRAYLDHLSHG